MEQLAKHKYYYPFEDVFSDISGINWMRYDSSGVVMNSKDRLLHQYKISKFDLYRHNKDKYYYHPASIAQCALGSFNLIAEGQNDPYRDIFMANIKWLIENGVLYGESIVYPFPFGLPDFHPCPDWVSGMYQGQVISALVRAYLILKDDSIISICEKIWTSFSRELGKKYGFRSETDNELWFEEAPQLPAKHILNGAIYAVWGIYDLMLLNDDKALKADWTKSVNTLKNNLHRYDAGFWSYYDLVGNLASYYYHNKVHAIQLRALYEQTSEPVFRDYAEKWSSYSKSIRSLILKKLMSEYHIITRKRYKYNKKLPKRNYDEPA